MHKPLKMWIGFENYRLWATTKKNQHCTLKSFNKCAVGIKHVGQKILEKSINMLDENLYILLKNSLFVR